MSSLITQQPKFIKSFSKGQITIPREVRKDLNLKDESWFKLYVVEGRVVLEPVFEEVSGDYAAMLLELDTSWFDFEEWKMLRKSAKKRQGKYVS